MREREKKNEKGKKKTQGERVLNVLTDTEIKI